MRVAIVVGVASGTVIFAGKLSPKEVFCAVQNLQGVRHDSIVGDRVVILQDTLLLRFVAFVLCVYTLKAHDTFESNQYCRFRVNEFQASARECKRLLIMM